MANQRKKDKKHLGGYYPPGLYDRVMRFCDDNNMTVTEFIEWSVREGIEKYGENEKGGKCDE